MTESERDQMGLLIAEVVQEQLISHECVRDAYFRGGGRDGAFGAHLIHQRDGRLAVQFLGERGGKPAA